MAVSDKLTYLNATKGLIKDTINLTGANILSTDTFRSYANSLKNAYVDIINNGIDTLYDNFPKVTAEGTEIVLNNTYEAPIKLNVVKGDTQQTKYNGKQLYNYTDTTNVTSEILVDNEGWITVTYDNTSGTSTKFLNYFTHNLNLDANTNYNIIAEIKTVSGNGVLYICSTNSNNNNGQFITSAYETLENLTSNSVINYVRTTKSSWEGDAGIRSYVSISAGDLGSITFRLSVIKDTTITPSTFIYEPYVGGKESPSPEFPQNINVVTGLQNVSVNGKNLFNLTSETHYENVSVNINDNEVSLTWTAGFNCYLNDTMQLDSTKTYTISFLHKGASIKVFRSGSNNDYFSTGINNDYTLIQHTFTGYSDFQIAIIRDGSTANVSAYLKNIQFEEGSATTYQPYKSATYTVDLGTLELCKIGDYQDFIKKSTGKNIFDGNYTNAYIGGDTGTRFQPSSNTRTAIVKVKPNTTYTVKKYINTGIGTRFSISEYPTILTSVTEMGANSRLFYDASATQATVTTGVNGYYLYVYVTNDTSNIPYLQIEEGLTASSDYEPYGKIWYKKANIGKVVLDGTEGGYGRSGSTIYATSVSNYATSNNVPYCNYFVGKENVSGASSVLDNTCCFINVSYETTPRLYFKSENNFVNQNEFTQWLATHNTTVYYILATPTYEVITNNTLINQLESIKSKNDVTNITISGNLPMIINASALEKE